MASPAAPHHAYGIEPSGFRLPDETRLGRVRLQVDDLDRSRSFYSEVLGLATLPEAHGTAVRDPDGTSTLDARGTALLGVPGDDEPLVELVEKPGARPVPRRGRLGLFHFAILLPDRESLGAFVRHLTERNIAFGASDHLVSEAVYLYDPDGLGIEVYADRPRTAWRHRGRQLQMATDPMDVDDVLRAGETAEWTGLPPGTRIGHVHLHVGEMDAARRFYHEGLGLDLMVWSYPGALFLAAGGYHHHLGLNTWAAGAPPAAEDEARLLDWELVLPSNSDVEEALASLRALSEELASRHGEAKAAERHRDVDVADPWGTRLRLRSTGWPDSGP